MELYEAMSTLRAVRMLRSDPIPDEVLQRVLTAATWAPTGGNVQPWRIVAVRDAAKKTALRDLYKPRWEAYVGSNKKRLEHGFKKGADSMSRTLASGDYLAEHMHEAPVIAVFCFNPGIMAITDIDQPRPTVVGGGSVYPSVENLLLACRAEGLGCVLTTLLCMDEPAVRELLQLPPEWYTCAHVPIGYPVKRGHGPISRRRLGDLVYSDTWGSAVGSAAVR